MLTELRNKLSPYNLLLSIAVAACESSALQSYEVPQVAAQVDFINVMIYDLHGPWETTTGNII